MYKLEPLFPPEEKTFMQISKHKKLSQQIDRHRRFKMFFFSEI